MKCCKCGIDLSHWDFDFERQGKPIPTDGIYCEDCAEEEGLPEGVEVGYEDSKHLGCKSYPFCEEFGCCRD
jgi:hypothetical protein